MAASVATALAEILAERSRLNMLLGLPILLGAVIVLAAVLWMQFTNSYKKIEKIIIAFVSVIGVSFIFELALVHIDWGAAVMDG